MTAAGEILIKVLFVIFLAALLILGVMAIILSTYFLIKKLIKFFVEGSNKNG